MGEYQPLNSNSIGELLSPIPGVMEESPAGNKVLNNSSIDELLSPKPRTITMSEDHVALLSNSIDEMPAQKADRSQRESFQPLTSNSKDKLISPKTSNLTLSEVDLPPLTSFIFAHKVTKRDLRASLSVRGR